MKTLMAAAVALAALMAAPALAGGPCTNGSCDSCDDGSCYGGRCYGGGCGGGLFGGCNGYNSDLYSHPMYGGPVNLVVPPNARRQGHYTWGSPSSHTTRIRSQFRANPRSGGFYGPSNITGYAPQWPQSTDQLGVYYTRAPYCY